MPGAMKARRAKYRGFEFRQFAFAEAQRLAQESKLTQAEMAERCGVQQPRINRLLGGHILEFSLEMLIDFIYAFGGEVALEFT